MSLPESVRRQPVTVEQILRLQTKLDLIFDVDLINDYIDVRHSVVLDMTPERIVITQSDPPILKSMVGRSLEATFVRRDPVTTEIMRWGWRSQVMDFLPAYKLRPEDTETMPALVLSPPLPGGLTETNARMDYRLTITNDKKISIQTHPSFGRVTPLDFSAGGVLIGIPKPPQAKIGLRLWFTLFFPTPTSPGQPITINGEAEVVRVTMEDDEPFARVGLKFLDLDLSATRALQKAINHYMLEEQRQRSRQQSASQTVTEREPGS